MPGPRTTLLIEGSFRELVEELADYIDNLKSTQGGSSSPVKPELAPLLDRFSSAEEAANDEESIDAARDAVLKPLVQNATVLNTAPDKEFVPAYNLLTHLVVQSQNTNQYHQYLQHICRSLSTDFPSSNPTRQSLATTALSTIFNTTEPEDSVRYNIFLAILDVVAKSGNFTNVKPQLVYIDQWLAQWETSLAQQRKLFLRVAQIAREAGEGEEAYEYLVRALRKVPSNEASSDEARKVSLEALKTALVSPSRFVFSDLTALDSVQALRTSEPEFSELLEIFTADNLEDYTRFKEEHSGWIENQGLDDAALLRKIRLLTLTSLAASTGQTRSLPYATIANDLQIPANDVEMWVIDVIRAGLVEGKLSQSTQTFLIHRSTYRVFTDSQWREVAGRLDMWKQSLHGVLEVIQQEKASLIAQKEQEQRAAESKANGGGPGGFRRQQQQQRDHHQHQQREPIDVGMD